MFQTAFLINVYVLNAEDVKNSAAKPQTWRLFAGKRRGRCRPNIQTAFSQTNLKSRFICLNSFAKSFLWMKSPPVKLMMMVLSLPPPC